DRVVVALILNLRNPVVKMWDMVAVVEGNHWCLGHCAPDSLGWLRRYGHTPIQAAPASRQVPVWTQCTHECSSDSLVCLVPSTVVTSCATLTPCLRASASRAAAVTASRR